MLGLFLVNGHLLLMSTPFGAGLRPHFNEAKWVFRGVAMVPWMGALQLICRILQLSYPKFYDQYNKR